MSLFLERAAEKTKELSGVFYTIAESNGESIESVRLNGGNPCQNSYSVAKAFAMTAIGILYDDGKIDLDEKIVDIFADELVPDMDERWNEMTLHHVMKHRCGFSLGYLDIDSHDSTTFGEDYLKLLFETKLNCHPGEEYNYSDAAYYLVSRVVSKKSGKKLDAFLWERLFFPMGFREVAWSCCPKGYPMGATGLYIYTEDMVKLGELYLCEGVYRGKRLLSKEWVDIVKEREYEFHRICDGRGYGKGGMRGQMLVFFPEAKKAIAWHSYGGSKLMAWIEENI
ncbi:MAG: serine hydrolase [Clostridia bacterium]|nr:serine hydrolase [Clostridia bacterium]